ncbi:MAG TPA: c-type cytochrome domain-containing protein [Parafilimonas sp.]|nr:c-type cytochrome domain-containing protein [Parafilimonas sp.]
MLQLIGHLHPAFVHLPIGILLMALLLLWLSKKEKYNIPQQVLKIVLLAGVFSALFSCVTGYILSTQDQYEKPLVVWHMWMGIAVALTSMVLYMKLARKEFDLIYKSLAVALLVLIFVTGHMGGSLTHGSDYLSFGSGDDDTIPIKPIPDIQEAKVYADVIQPIFQTKCYSCHSSKKQKGGLRLDKFELMIKGGKDGKIIMPGNPDESDIIKRLLLPEESEDHMPPRDKPQPNDKQIALLHWWIENGNDTAGKVKDMPQPEPVKSYLFSLQQDQLKPKSLPIIPATPVEIANDKAIEALKDRGVIVLPVAQNSNYLMANFVTATNITDKDFALLVPLKKQLVWLKCGDMKIGDSSLNYIAQCTNINFLQLNNTLVTDKGLQQLAALKQLQSLNLVGTNVSGEGIKALADLKQLQSLYLYQTKINKAEWAMLKKEFPKTLIDSGGYDVPLLPGDTTILKAPVYK